ncbi:DUF6531 domain-containing protein, partial [Sulfurirhabdus autotrophica]
MAIGKLGIGFLHAAFVCVICLFRCFQVVKSTSVKLMDYNLQLPRTVLLVVYMFLFMTTISSAGTFAPPLRFFGFTGTGPVLGYDAESRPAACQIFLEAENAQYGPVFSNPRFGRWTEGNPSISVSPYQYSCLYTSILQGVVNNNDERWPGMAYCGSDYYHNDQTFSVDRNAGLCVCTYDATSVFDECISACPTGQTKIGQTCHGGKNNGAQPNQCVGIPILTGSGNKFQHEPIWQSGSGMDFSLSYNHNDSQISSFGRRWRSSFDSMIQTDVDGSIIVFRNDGKVIRYQKNGTVWGTDADTTDKLQEILDANSIRIGWQYRVSLDDSIESYDASGRLTSTQQRNKLALTFKYSDGTAGADGDIYIEGGAINMPLPAGRLIKVQDANGRVIRFRYGVREKITQFIDPSGAIYRFKYDALSNLTAVIYPDNTLSDSNDNPQRIYVYNESANINNGAACIGNPVGFPNALTSMIDTTSGDSTGANGTRYANWKYDCQGRATSSEHAPGLALGIDNYQLTYKTNPITGNPYTVVTDPRGFQRTYNFTTVLGVVKSTGTDQPGGSGCSAASSALTYDANGNIKTRADFSGNVTWYDYDMTRNLETTRIEAQGKPEARTIETDWHNRFRLPTEVREKDAGNVLQRVTHYTYDGDNLSSTGVGNLTTVTIKDTASSKTRTWTYNYTTSADNTLINLLKSVDGPRTDVNDITRYTYYTADDTTTTPPKYRRGDLNTLSN